MRIELTFRNGLTATYDPETTLWSSGDAAVNRLLEGITEIAMTRYPGPHAGEPMAFVLEEILDTLGDSITSSDAELIETDEPERNF